MNKNRKIKRGLTTSLAVGMSVMMGAVPVFAAGTSSDADAVYEEFRQCIRKSDRCKYSERY